ncbi:hypothetical protein AQI88_34345 [Streptomyces cellostaticus]|uniref:Uncharacterized protein n=1 Tax=Streptomyces cellostaticus TaxID=67285 RepID=A0A101NEZ4_9ACTN|nr:hypothetical protein [Streptomyces cellostaticus]KUM91872.1 hypothetical protein AQI88_34345 [Streptomyces cellostaticus]GHI06980.1 hypothetical protein Scel_53010 [Streptomyces cellostaticus]
MSNSIDGVDDVTFTQVNLLARAWNVSPADAVRKLIEHFQRPDAVTQAASAKGERVAVHALYGGVRIEGEYDPVTQTLTVTTGPAAGDYRTPSGAASAVLQAVNPQVKPNRNGWSFWVVTETGGLLQTLRPS